MPSPPRAASVGPPPALAELQTQHGIKDTEVAYLVIDAETGVTVAQHASATPMPPASTAKLATMIAALGILGPEHRFTTEILAKGTFKNGVVSGDLILTGDGDPMLALGDLRALAVRLADFGIRRLDGRYLYGGSLSEFADVEPAQPAEAPYNQGVGSLNLEFNRDWDANDPILERPIRDPSARSARVFRNFAAMEGITLPAPIKDQVPAGAVRIASISSQPLSEIARAGLRYSNNMVAEAVGLSATDRLGTRAESLSQSASALGAWLAGEVPGLSGFASKLRNHSGLSTESRLTPADMVALLRYAYGKRFEGWRFDTLLTASGGRDGFDARFRSPSLQGRVWAKTGTMHYIKGLAGYLDARSGRRLIFALYSFDPKARAAFDALDPANRQALRTAATAWRRRVLSFEENLVTDWIDRH